ncbi:DUF3307 domain-containing protein [Virgibacillus dakarensis]|uniref:DUF3307 domain-containing protein n=1 Tax=Virgibacillus dakarensis TaxID=1917889 RepID=UPI000B4438DE|nr:DUF3307 domain-containing protein [Virgibacillus dakarensis]MBT2214938.1 DUF3307 domain-containing protein [Virgibacillus dakarensis]MTW84813.1 DUF3307 domain-containing protein [Virgibacillus dakarensis]
MTILLLLLAHFIADFWLQSDQMVKQKIKYLKKHMLHHLLTTGITLAIIWGYQYSFQHVIRYFILPFVFIIVTHLLIDWLKIKLVNAMKSRNLARLGYFLLDQALHVLMILITCILFFHMQAPAMAEKLLDLYGEGRLTLFDTMLLMIIIYILATSVSGHIVKHIIGSFPSELANFEGALTLRNQMNHVPETKQPQKENSFTEEYHYYTYSTPLRSHGKWIGYIERLLVILLTAISAYQAIALIIAAKSIARFKQLDDRNWAEYFLLGTLSSILLGLVLGLVVQAIL